MGVAEAVAAAEAEVFGVETTEVEVVPDPRVAVKMMFRMG
ncbi:metal-sulfur cluster biosynthetic enzyme [Arthrobacter sp. W4I7]|nr:metal-sulfur cluster biosynthetic enzyme [Arthrobacter sp. W4I7]